jgi:YegS/Rv2252/BmrU family lipid kinase
MKKVLMVINPKAGKGTPIDFAEKLKEKCNELEVQLSTYWTNGKNDSENIKKSLEENAFDQVYAAGGDGTVLMTSNVVKDFPKLKMGIIPMGTSNGLATDLNIPTNPLEAFCVQVESEDYINLDSIVLNESERILHIGDIGANASLVKRFESTDDEGYAAYSKHLLDQLQELESFKYQIESNGEKHEGEAVMIAVCNARSFGTGIPLTINGHPGDGKFELVILKQIDLKTLMQSTLTKISENFFTDDDRIILQASEATIKLEKPVLYQTDGEVKEKKKEYSLKMETNYLRLICSPDCPYSD